jgi:hypothetical protein
MGVSLSTILAFSRRATIHMYTVIYSKVKVKISLLQAMEAHRVARG